MAADPANSAQVFDRRAVAAHRARAAKALENHDFLLREAASGLASRLADMSRTFAVAVEIGCRGGALAEALTDEARARHGIEALFHAAPGPVAAGGRASLAADEEALPFAQAGLDLVFSNLSLHWINDLPGALTQIRQALRPDGLFLGTMLGGDTLIELRRAFEIAEIEIEGGVSPRVSPFVDVRDAGALLQRAGFALPVADVDTLRVSYADIFALAHDVRGMGESNAVATRRTSFLRRDTLMRAAQAYRDQFADDDGRLVATFQIVYLAGWAPHESQQKPLRPGSAKARLADALGVEEHTAGEKTGPR
jgi:SAM-dependent methyltransferase